MESFTVKVQPEGTALAREEQLAWKIAAVAADPAEVVTLHLIAIMRWFKRFAAFYLRINFSEIRRTCWKARRSRYFAILK
jgi:hypothetical protein